MVFFIYISLYSIHVIDKIDTCSVYCVRLWAYATRYRRLHCCCYDSQFIILLRGYDAWNIRKSSIRHTAAVARAPYFWHCIAWYSVYAQQRTHTFAPPRPPAAWHPPQASAAPTTMIQWVIEKNNKNIIVPQSARSHEPDVGVFLFPT